VRRDIVKKFMQLNEVRPLHVPMGLFGLRFEVDGVGQTSVEQIDESERDFLEG